MEDAREVVVIEAAVRAGEAREGAGARVGVHLLPRLDDGGDEIREFELVERLPGVLEGFIEDVLGPFDILCCRGRVPLDYRT